VVVRSWQASDEVGFFAKSAISLIVGEANDLGVQLVVRAVWIGDRWVCALFVIKIGVSCKDIVVAGALTQFWVQCKAHQAILAAW
jgi:hypothetical protein